MLNEFHSLVFGFGIVSSIFYYLFATATSGSGLKWQLYFYPSITLLALTICWMARRDGLRLKLLSADWGLIALTSYALFTIPFAASSTIDALRSFFTFFVGSIGYWYARYSDGTIDLLWRRSRAAFVCAGLISSVALFYQWYDPTGITLIFDDDGTRYELLKSREIFGTISEFRLSGLGINPTHVATLLGLALVVVAYGSQSFGARLVVGLIFVVTSLLTDSRLPLITAVAVIVTLMPIFDRRRTAIAIVASVTAAIVFMVSGLLDEMFGPSGVLALARLALVLGDQPMDVLFGRLHETGVSAPAGIQLGAEVQSDNILSILDSQYLWIYFEFGIVGLAATLFWLRGVWIGAFSAVDRSMTGAVLFLILISVKQYPLMEKSMLLFSYLVLGIAVTNSAGRNKQASRRGRH